MIEMQQPHPFKIYLFPFQLYFLKLVWPIPLLAFSWRWVISVCNSVRSKDNFQRQHLSIIVLDLLGMLLLFPTLYSSPLRLW